MKPAVWYCAAAGASIFAAATHGWACGLWVLVALGLIGAGETADRRTRGKGWPTNRHPWIWPEDQNHRTR